MANVLDLAPGTLPRPLTPNEFMKDVESEKMHSLCLHLVDVTQTTELHVIALDSSFKSRFDCGTDLKNWGSYAKRIGLHVCTRLHCLIVYLNETFVY